jgi:hypothetical protein
MDTTERFNKIAKAFDDDNTEYLLEAKHKYSIEYEAARAQRQQAVERDLARKTGEVRTYSNFMGISRKPVGRYEHGEHKSIETQATGVAIINSYVGPEGKALTYDDVKALFARLKQKEMTAEMHLLAGALKPQRNVVMKIHVPPEKESFQSPSNAHKSLALVLQRRGIKVLAEPILFPSVSTPFVMGPIKRKEAEKFLAMMDPDPETVFVPEKYENDVVDYRYSTTDGVLAYIGKRRPDNEAVTLTFKTDLFPKAGREARAYNPAYTYTPHWMLWMDKFYKRLTTGKFGTKERTEEAAKIYEEFYDMVVSHYFGSGTPDGQIGRLQAVDQVYMETIGSAKKRLRQDAMNAEASRIVNKHFYRYSKGLPKLMTDDIASVLGRTYKVTYRDGSSEDIVLEMKINLQAGAGPMWPARTKRASVILQDIVLASKMLTALHKKQDDPKNKKFWEEYEYIKVVNFMPKAEVYLLSERDDKTRNICVYTSFCQLPCHLIDKSYHRHLAYALDEPVFFKQGKQKSEGTLSLLGFTPFGGGITRLLELYKEAMTEGWNFAAAYADNSFAFVEHKGDYYHLSIDGNKAEASIDGMVVKAYNSVIAKAFFEEGGLSDSWIAYYAQVYPEIATTPVGLWGASQIPLRQLGSGTTGTSSYNTYRQIQVLNACIERQVEIIQIQDGDVQLTPAFISLASSMQVSLKLTKATKFTLDTFAFEKGLGATLELDLLGFDCQAFRIDADLTIMMPVLARDRLLATLAYNKKHYDTFGRSLLGPVLSNFLTLVKMRAAFLLGAWSSGPLLDMVQYFATNALYHLGTSIDFTNEDVTEMFELALNADYEEWKAIVPSIADLLVRPELPTVWEIVKIGTGDENLADRAALYREGSDMEERFLAPPQVFLRLFDRELPETPPLEVLMPSVINEFPVFFSDVSGMLPIVRKIKNPEPPVLAKKPRKKLAEAVTDVGPLKPTKQPLLPVRPGFSTTMVDKVLAIAYPNVNSYVRVPLLQSQMRSMLAGEVGLDGPKNFFFGMIAAFFSVPVDSIRTQLTRLTSKIRFIALAAPSTVKGTEDPSLATSDLPLIRAMDRSKAPLQPGLVLPSREYFKPP